MTYSIKAVNTPEIIQNFLSLPARLYDKKTLTQNLSEEEQIISKKHPLSHYFTFEAFVVYEGKEAVGRVMLFHYAQDTQCFIGYYECIDSVNAAALLFDTVERRARTYIHVNKIVGPYNASFWLTYRLKVDGFENQPYMGEPYNKPYYKKQFTAAGFVAEQTYISNEYGFSYDPKEAKNYSDATKRATRLNYVIKSPKPDEFIQTLSQSYELFSTLYTDFAGYKPITKSEFLASFTDLKYVLNYSFVKFAYLGNELAGFAVAFPDYGNLLHRPMTFMNKLAILRRKVRSKRYIIIYLGVKPEHSGLSKALVRPLVISALLRGARIVGALALDTKVTASYGKSMIKKQYHYELYGKNI